MLWDNYVFAVGNQAHELWDSMYADGEASILFISGIGFDTRGCIVLESFLENLRNSNARIRKFKLLLIDFAGYELGEDLSTLTKNNEKRMRNAFANFGEIEDVSIRTSADGDDDLSPSMALKLGTEKVTDHIQGYTDVILDVSSLPRVVYISLMAGILRKLIPDFSSENSLYAKGVNFQILVAEDPELDSKIQSLDPSNDTIFVPGFSSALHAESYKDWPVVWFPILGEGRVPQFDKIKQDIESESLETCPVLPHPSRNPKRGDLLLLEYRVSLQADDQTPISNILYAHEGNPFEAYRQILNAINRYIKSMMLLGGSRLAVTPLASKLITIGAGLACLESHVSGADGNYIVTMPYVEPTRYTAPSETLEHARPEISSLLLTGPAYEV